MSIKKIFKLSWTDFNMLLCY